LRPQMAPLSKIRPEMPKTILRIKNLRKVFRNNGSFLTVLDEINFTVRRGEMICLLGRSGCGKSTLLKILAGFLFPSSGAVLINDKPVTGPGPDRCVVFQEDTLFPWLTVKENIAFGLKGRTREKDGMWEEVEHFLSLVGLSEFRDYLPQDISGGMRQRVALARVLILKPKLLLMDEAMACMHPNDIDDMVGFIKRVAEEKNIAIVAMVEHIMRAVIGLAEKVIVLHQGSKIVDAPTKEALEDPKVVEVYLGHAPED